MNRDHILRLRAKNFGLGQSADPGAESAQRVVVEPDLGVGQVVVNDQDQIRLSVADQLRVAKSAAAEVLERAQSRLEDERRSRAAFARGETPWKFAGYQRVADARGMSEEPADGTRQ